MEQGQPEPIRVCVVEAQAVFRDAWSAIVDSGEMEVGAVAGTPDEWINAVFPPASLPITK